MATTKKGSERDAVAQVKVADTARVMAAAEKIRERDRELRKRLAR